MIPVNLENKLNLEDFKQFVGEAEVNAVRTLADELKGKTVLMVNSTAFGGGVAEKLHDMVPLMNAVGIDARWKVLEGSLDFFKVTKKIHNALQGMSLQLSKEEEALYVDVNKKNSEEAILDYDFVTVHDNQPAAIIQYQPRSKGKWIWRCHVDTSTPNLAVWSFLEHFVSRYDAAIFTSKKYVIPSFNMPKIAIRPPSINPISPKNQEIPHDEVVEILRKLGVNPERPIITQVARFDPWKDPLGVIDVYRLVKKEVPQVQLLLVASMATDDPEGWLYFEKTARHAGDDNDIFFLTDLKGVRDLEVNAIQRASSVALQMSTREGFGLTVAESMWKNVPVVGRNVGGIPLQIINGVTGYLVETVSEAAEKTIYLLKHADEAKAMGAKGREHVRTNFLIINNLKEYLKLFKDLTLPTPVQPAPQPTPQPAASPSPEEKSSEGSNAST